jgi:hypothetical protein
MLTQWLCRPTQGELFSCLQQCDPLALAFFAGSFLWVLAGLKPDRLP